VHYPIIRTISKPRVLSYLPLREPEISMTIKFGTTLWEPHIYTDEQTKYTFGDFNSLLPNPVFHLTSAIFLKKNCSRTHSEPKFVWRGGGVILMPGLKGSGTPFRLASFWERTSWTAFWHLTMIIVSCNHPSYKYISRLCFNSYKSCMCSYIKLIFWYIKNTLLSEYWAFHHPHHVLGK